MAMTSSAEMPSRLEYNSLNSLICRRRSTFCHDSFAIPLPQPGFRLQSWDKSRNHWQSQLQPSPCCGSCIGTRICSTWLVCARLPILGPPTLPGRRGPFRIPSILHGGLRSRRTWVAWCAFELGCDVCLALGRKTWEMAGGERNGIRRTQEQDKEKHEQD